MFIVRLADYNIKINNTYPFLERLCRDYIITDSNFDLEISISEEEIAAEQNKADVEYSKGYLESLACYRKLSLELTNYNCFLMHAAVLEVDNKGYAFLARSGTGKTTHTKLWQKLLGSKMKYVNGDKPLIKIINGIPYAYGTPWNGKEAFGENTKVELKALCFLERGIENSIVELPKKNVLNKIIHQILIPSEESSVIKTFNALNTTINYVDTYLLKCNMDIEAAKIAYNEMSKK